MSYHCYMQMMVITPESDVADEQRVVNELFAAGLHRLHVRKPGYTANDLRNYISKIDGHYHKHVVVHSCFELFAKCGLGGVHLNSAVREDHAAWHDLRDIAHGSISTSFHSWQEIKANEVDYGYVFISPVFDSISKPGYTAAIELQGANAIKKYKAEKHQYCPAIIGLGGVGVQEINVLHNYGFDGAAVLGAIWTSPDPVGIFKEMITMSRK